MMIADQLRHVVALLGQGDFQGAERICREILAQDRNQPDALYLLGTVLLRQGRRADAALSFGAAIAINPGHLDARLGRAHALLAEDRGPAAVAALADIDYVLAVTPESAAAHNTRGGALQILDRFDDALESYRRASALQPDNVQVLHNLGVLLMEMGQCAESLVVLERAVRLQPGNAEGWYRYANALRDGDRWTDAIEAYDRAAALDRSWSDPIIGRGLALFEARRTEDASAAFAAAIALEPQNPSGYRNLGRAAMAVGRRAEAQSTYDWLLRNPPQKDWGDYMGRPLWLGREDIAGKTILLIADQGFGDVVQFCRYVPAVAARGARVILQASDVVMPLLRSLAGVSEYISVDETPTSFDFHCPLSSLPLALGTTVETIPASIPYLSPDPALVAQWRSRLGDAPTPRIGLAWSGRRSNWNNRYRSMAVQQFAPLFALDAQFVSLHKDVTASDLAWIESSGRITQFPADYLDFSSTAALISLLDVVVSIDSSLAHVAGALGRNTCLLLPHISPDWRWMISHDATPWYPATRLFRQSKKGDWAGPMAQVESHIAAMPRARG